jgi:integrase
LRVKPKRRKPRSKPIIVRDGSASVTIYPTVNRIYRFNSATGTRELKSAHPQFTLVYYSGPKRVKQKFSDLAAAQAEARNAVVKLANGDAEALKLTGRDRAAYLDARERLRQWRPDAELNSVITDHVRSMRHLHEWRADAELTSAVSDYVRAIRRLPDGISLTECVNAYLKRHPTGLPPKNVQEVTDELVEVKRRAGKSEIYLKDLEGRLNSFATAFNVRLATISGSQIETYIRGLTSRGRALSGRSQNNHRRIIGTLMKFAIKRGYLPRDHDEISAVERADDDSGEIEIFTPDELRKLFENARAEMIPYLAIAAFAGLHAAELQRLDWCEVNIARRFIEVKASKSKTASRRLAPVPDNLAAWLTRHSRTSGPVAPFANMSKQLTEVLAPIAGVKWKHNGLRHSFISYRVAVVQDVGKVALEAGNSPQMIFKHYRELVTPDEAKDWFSIMPTKESGVVVSIIPNTPETIAADRRTPAAASA